MGRFVATSVTPTLAFIGGGLIGYLSGGVSRVSW